MAHTPTHNPPGQATPPPRWERGTNEDDVFSGTAADDRYQGRQGDDLINGGAGDDHLLGQGGNDTIHGGGGADTMTGGPGRDTFHFGSPTAPNVIPWAIANDAFGDRITDFQPGVDTIDLSAFGTRRAFDGTLSDPHTFRFIGTGGFHGDGVNTEVRYEHLLDGTTRIQADGYICSCIKEGPDGRPDLFIVLDGHLTLNAGDFIL